MLIILLILSGVLLNTIAQLLLKAGMSNIGQFEFSLANALPISTKILLNGPIMTGIGLYGLSVVIWLLVLSRVQVSIAYPMLSIGYIVNALAAYYLFGEPLSMMRFFGIMVIIVGVYLITQTA